MEKKVKNIQNFLRISVKKWRGITLGQPKTNVR